MRIVSISEENVMSAGDIEFMETERELAHPASPRPRGSRAETSKRSFTFFIAESLRLRDAGVEPDSNAPATSGVNRLKSTDFEKLKTLADKDFHSREVE